jgi:hypothetical protein
MAIKFLSSIRFTTIYHKTKGYGLYIFAYLQDSHPVEIHKITGNGSSNFNEIDKNLYKHNTLRNLNLFYTVRQESFYLKLRNIIYKEKIL